MLSFLCRLTLIVCLFLPRLARTQPAEKEELLSQQHLTEFTLKNGMKVCLKQTDYEEETVIFQLFAMGGYAALAPNDRPSGALAADIAWESGLGNRTSDQIFYDLYQNSIEFQAKIQPFDRQIEAYCYTSDLPTCLNIVNLLFTEAKFEKEALQSILETNRQHIRTKSHQVEPGIRETFLKLHHQNEAVFDPLTLTDLDYVNLSKAENFFKQCFSNPSEFVFVMIGDFNPTTVRSLLEKYIESIPQKAVLGPVNPPLPSFPEGIMKKDITGFHRYREPLTRLTFPIQVNMTESTTQSLELLCHIIKDRLTRTFPPYRFQKKLEVSYEFPFFPRFDQAWLTIQFCTHSPNEISLLTKTILSTLEQLQAQGPTQEELKNLKAYLEKEDTEIEENTYILSLLSNYYRAKWDITYLYTKKERVKLEKEVFKNDLNRYLKLDQYSIISLYP